MNTPIPGDRIPPIPIPAGKTCFYTSWVQSSLDQYIRLNDPNNSVLFTLTGKSSKAGDPTPLGDGAFRALGPGENHTIHIGTSGGARWSRVLYAKAVLALGPSHYCTQHTYVSEDSGDNDFNDSFITLYWFDRRG